MEIYDVTRSRNGCVISRRAVLAETGLEAIRSARRCEPVTDVHVSSAVAIGGDAACCSNVTVLHGFREPVGDYVVTA